MAIRQRAPGAATDGLALALASLFTCACGNSGPGATADAAADATPSFDARNGGPPEIDPPVPPALPLFLPCPDGWREVREGMLAACHPWPGEEQATCGPGEAHFPGGAGCEVVGPACPEGEFADPAPTGVIVVHVSPTGSPDAAGTTDDPFDTIAGAIASLGPDGGAVSVGKGVFDETITLPSNVTLTGACTRDTVIARTEAGAEPTIHVTGTGATLQNVTLAGEREGVIADAGSELTAEQVIVDGAMKVGVMAQGGAMLTARDLVVRNMRGRPGQQGDGGAVAILGGSRMVLERGALGPVRYVGVVVLEGSHLDMTDTSVSHVAVVEGTDEFGRGLVVSAATARVARIVIEHVVDMGLLVSRPTGRLELSHVLIRDVAARPVSGLYGRGLQLQRETTVEGGPLRVTESHEQGIFIGESSSGFLHDVAVTHTRVTAATDGFGRGLDVMNATLTAERVLLEGNRTAGLLLSIGATATLTDLTSVRNLPWVGTGTAGRGAGVQTGARLTLTRATLEENSDAGLFIDGATSLARVEDLVVRGTESTVASGTLGVGVLAQQGASIEGERLVLDDNSEVSVAVHSGASATLRHVDVRRTRVRGCVEVDCADTPMGVGLGAYSTGSLVAELFRVENNPMCGVQVSRDGEMDLSLGLVANNFIGACLGSEAFDTERVSSGVWFVDNGQNLDASELPTPDPAR